MPSVIDSLVVELGIDADKFVRSQRQLVENFEKTKDSIKKQGGQVEKSVKDAGETVQKLTAKFLGLFAVLTGGRGLKDFTEWVTRSDAALGRMAANLDISSQTLYNWQHVSTRMGGSTEDATAALSRMNTAIQELKRGNVTAEYQRLMDFLGRSGGIPEGYDVRKRSLDQVMEDIAEHAQNLERTMGRAFAATQLQALGFSDSMVNAMLLGKDALKGYLAEAEKYGKITKADEEASKALVIAWNNLKDASEDLGRSIRTAFAPDAIRLFTDLANNLSNIKRFGFIEALKNDLDGLLAKRVHIEAFGQELLSFGWGGGISAPWLYKWFPSAETFKKGIASIEAESAIISDAFKRIYSKLPQFGEQFKDGFWRAVHSLEAEGAVLLETFKRIFNPILDWLREKFGSIRSWFGLGPAVGGGLAPLGPGGGIALSPPSWEAPTNRRFLGPRGAARQKLGGRSNALPGSSVPGSGTVPGSSVPGSGAEAKSVIDAAAKEAGIDPRVMYGIVFGESLHKNTWDVGDQGTSFGPFQFRAVPGAIGDRFQKETGEDPRNPKSFPRMAKWLAHYIARGESLSPWRGYSGPKDWNPSWGSMGIGGAGAAIGGGNYGLAVRPGVESQMAGVDSRLKEVMAAAAKHMPPGYKIRVTSGYSPTHGGPGSQHRRGKAIDVEIIDPSGRPIPNRGPDRTGMYELLSRHAEGEARARYGIRMGHGINFGTSSRNPEEPDLMHQDFGGPRGHFGPKIEPVPGEKYGREFTRDHGAAAAQAARERLMHRDHPIHGLLNDIRAAHRAIFGHPHITHHHGPVTTNNASHDTRIGEVHVHTHATDAAGIARDIKPALERTGIVMHANYSLA
jgi:hypothetical protein